MPRFEYNGDHENMVAFGYAFPADVEDEFVIAKLRGNSHFDEVKTKSEPSELPMKKHRGRGKYDVWDANGVQIGDNVTREEADQLLGGLDGDQG